MHSLGFPGWARLLAVASLASLLGAAVTLGLAPGIAAPRPLQIMLPPMPEAAGAAGPMAEFEGYLEVSDGHHPADRLNWKWGYRKVR